MLQCSCWDYMSKTQTKKILGIESRKHGIRLCKTKTKIEKEEARQAKLATTRIRG